MSDLRAYVANYLGGGEDFSKHGKMSVRDTLNFQLDGYSFKLIQNKDIITIRKWKYKDQFIKSSEIIVRNVKEKDVKKGLFRKICG
ncbi:MAG: hypothetical protein JMN25_18625 [gamma proteobacterium endosymbiont of Lamellibrachia anaximandri]|nr:hypothetical protein [gamma proteobacterium endosymbiont of Lamellibrachia anaximandri]